MVISGAALAVYVGFSSAVSACLALAAATVLGERSRQARSAATSTESGDSVVFLFDGTDLVDATRAGERLLAAAPSEGSDWTRLQSLLATEFPEIAERIDNLAVEGRQTLHSSDLSTRLTAEWQNGLRRLTLVDDDIAPPAADIDVHNLAAMEREIEILRANTDFSPALVWRQNAEGEITWFNRRYLEELRRLQGPAAADHWPVKPLFDTGMAAEAEKSRSRLRASVAAGENESWFDVFVRTAGDELVCTALPIDQLVKSERQLRSFRQTLTKTFADLDEGLAIFDRSRRLVMFNPALADLTGLSPGFLSAHPTLFGVLDRMRNNGRVPEPRNYSEWRRRMAELESDAAEGNFRETWALPTGETLRVTGRPHPDGAVAFIFEDISAEISMTRRFRSELEIGQALLDTLDDAAAVFSSSGSLAMSNAAYVALWGTDPMESLAKASISEVLPVWEGQTAPSHLWTEAAAFLASTSGRSPLSGDAMLLDGRAITCRFDPLAGGAALVRFEVKTGQATNVGFRRHA